MGHRVQDRRVPLRPHGAPHEAERDRLARPAPLAPTGLEGVDGPRIYLYGEGWDFGEVENGKRGENASQARMAGTGVGTFNDRIRDAIRGGSPFSDRRAQGFGTGLVAAPAYDGDGEDAQDRLAESTDRLRIALTGNLRDFRLVDRNGDDVRAGDVYLGGYASTPTESIQYVSAHDNETLFDKVLFSTPPDLPLEDRIRMQVLSLALVILAQGIPFLHAGSELLRSKSFDADSYRSGDWFNQLDFSGDTHGFGRGLPPAKKNADRWEILRPILSRRDLLPSKAEILRTRDQIEAYLRIRKGSPLFRLSGTQSIQEATTFLDQGAAPGWIAYTLTPADGAGHPDSPARKVKSAVSAESAPPDVTRLCVVFHAHGSARELAHPALVGRSLQLHPLLANGTDPLLTKEATHDPERGTIRMPRWSAAVFVDSPDA
ncbi:MAG: alpha-1,6-glucosidase domain-containing protein [Candidatus Eisenbacteria bacterium]